MVKNILLLFVSSRVLFLVFALLAVQFIPLDTGYIGSQSDPNAPYLAWVWANFDGKHFIKIAETGYTGTNFAYFPLYPMLISLVAKTGVPPLYAGIAISAASLFATTTVIYKITLLDFKPKIAFATIVMLLFFPLSFFYHTVYADSLFLLLTTLSFYFARKGKWALAGIFGSLAALGRFSGVALVPALAFEWYLQNKGRLQKEFLNLVKVLLLTTVGLLAYMFYLKISFGDPLLFQKSFSAWSQQNLTFPLQVFFRYLKILIFVEKDLLVYWIAVLELVSILLYFALSIYVFKKIRSSYGIFMITLLSLVAFTGTFAGTPRYILHLFPAFIALACLTYKRPKLTFAVLLLFLVLGFLLTGLFTRGYFVG